MGNDYNAYFFEMYCAHETIATIRERAQRLYDEVTSTGGVIDGMPKTPNPERFSNTICEMADLTKKADKLLERRARFDSFYCDLTPFYRGLLDLKFQQFGSWKYIAGRLDISTTSARRVYRNICDMGTKANLFEYP